MRLPDFMKKGLMLYGDAKTSPDSPETLAKLAKAYREEGRVHDALECFRLVNHPKGIEEIVNEAVSEGDYFLFLRGMEALNLPIDKTRLIELARSAREKGKLTFAFMAYRDAGDEALAREVESLMSNASQNGETAD